MRLLHSLGLAAIAALIGASAFAAGGEPPLPPELPSNTTPEPTDPTTQPKVQDLGNQQYRVGLIRVDRRGERFTVPAAVLRNEPPLEFLATATGGHKAYEALLEVGATAYEFNLACILIGLDSEGARAPRYHFDPNPSQGQPVDLFVEWKKGTETTRIHAADLIVLEGKTLPRSSWVYTGSVFTPDGRYMAHIDGTLVGFIHDPASIIEHRTGFLDSFDDVVPNLALLPPVGDRLTLVVERLKGTEPRKDEAHKTPMTTP